MKKAVCISCTNHYNERAEFFENVFALNGYDCTYITSNFDHIAKQFYKIDRSNTIQIPTKPYKRNLSLGRILSHMKFARDTLKKVAEINPDLLYLEIPPNSLCREAAKFKKKHPNTTLVFDIFDMWPETFPNNKLKFLLKLPFGVWGWFRNSSVSCADVVVTECDMFAKEVDKHLVGKKAQTLYMCRNNPLEPNFNPNTDGLHLCYLGSIHNIIDIPTITALIKELQSTRQVTLHIIGEGESRPELISQVESTGAMVNFYGAIYDDAKKQEIYNKCHFGLNIMKDTVFVGLTMKSVDYFSAGLPIINSIGGDTNVLVEKDNAGININRQDLKETADAICSLSPDQIIALKKNAYNCYKNHFTEKIFSNKLNEYLYTTQENNYEF